MAARQSPYRLPSGRRRGGRSSGGNLKTWMLGVLTAVIVASTAGAIGWTKLHHVDVDTATLCPLTGPMGVHAVLLDRSDPITALQAQRVRQVIDQIVANAEIGERIDLYVLTADGAAAMHPLLSLCRPKSEGHMLYENATRIHEHYVEYFRQPLDTEINKLMEPSTTETSPIMESIKAVCVAAFGNLPTGTPVHLTIASDMIQYSSLMDHYKQRDFDAFSHTPAFKEVLADCHGAKVDVLYLVRPKDVRVQDRRHELFWEKYLDRMDATLVKLEAI